MNQKPTKEDFVHLHAHTDASIQDALPKVNQLALRAREMGQIAIAKTDHGRMNDTIPFVEACRAPHETLDPIKPIIGAEIYMHQFGNRFDKTMVIQENGKTKRPHRHLTVLCKNAVGYKNLCNVTSEASTPESHHYNPIADENLLFPHHKGLIVLSGCLGSELNQTLLKGGYEAGLAVAKRYKEVFGEDYYIELHYHGIEAQKQLLQDQIKIARAIGSDCVAANDVHYLHQEDWRFHKLMKQMRGINDNPGGAGGGKDSYEEAYGSKQFWLKSEREMRAVFGKFPEALTNTLAIAEKVEDFLKLDVAHLLPKANVPLDDPKFMSFYQDGNRRYMDAEDAYLAYLTFSGLKRLGLFGKKVYMERAGYELLTIRAMGVTSYFLLQHEMAAFMNKNEILFGIRGSGVGSLVIYALGVSDVDPIRWNLLFERFLNPGRGTQFKLDLDGYSAKDWNGEVGEADPILLEEADAVIDGLRDEALRSDKLKENGPDITKEAWIVKNQGLSLYLLEYRRRQEKGDIPEKVPNGANSWFAYLLGITEEKPIGPLQVSKYATLPDVDTDIDDSRRQEVIEWARGRFGADHVAMIGTKGTFQAKAAVKASLKVSDKFRARWGEKVDMMATVITKTIPTRQQPPMTIDDAFAESAEFRAHMREWPDELEAARRLVGLTSHEGVHAGGVLVASVPISDVCPLNNAKGVMASAYDMAAVERIGLVKYDYLGLATYQMLARALKMVERRHGKKLNLSAIPLDDPKVLSLYAKGLTSTIFQCASHGMQKSLREVQVSGVSDLVAVISLFRPGPLEYIPQYAAGKKNPSKIVYEHELLEKHLKETHKIAVYQEQLMFLFREMAGFSWQEVDKVRKAVSKKQGKDFEKACQDFNKRAVRRGIPQSVVDEVLHLVEAFGGYAFNRCVTGETLVSDAITGAVSSVRDLYAKPGTFHVHALGEDGKLLPRCVTHVVANGRKPVFDLATENGQRIRATDNHPFRTLTGWKNLGDLRVGEFIALPRRLTVEGGVSWPKHEVVALAGLLAEGNTCHPSTLYFYNNDVTLIDDFTEATRGFSDTVTKITTRQNGRHVVSVNTGADGRFAVGGGGNRECGRRSGMYLWAQALGITGKTATEKVVPKAVFTLCDEDIALFLGRLWAGDEFLANHAEAMPFYATSSEQLARDVQHLLLRLGITSAIKEKKFRYRGGIKIGWTVRVMGEGAVDTFVSRVVPHIVGRKSGISVLIEQRGQVAKGCASKDCIPQDVRFIVNEERLSAGLTWRQLGEQSGVAIREFIADNPNKGGFRRATISKLAEFFGSSRLLDLATSDVIWCRVQSIWTAGEEETYDLTVSTDHNFVANGIIVHNSHGTGYALLSYKTAYMRFYYPAEWVAACMQVDKDDEDKMAVYRRECELERIKVLPPSVNHSGFDTTVSPQGVICLPLTSIKGVGSMAQSIISEQPFDNLKDLAARARPNKGIIQALVEGGALDCFTEIKATGGNLEAAMDLWAMIVSQRDAEEKELARAAKMKYKPKLSVFGEDTEHPRSGAIAPAGLGDSGMGRARPAKKSKFANNPFGLDNSFARDLG